MKEKILHLIDNIGLFETPKILGISIYNVMNLINGVDNLTFDQRLKFITDFTKEAGGISFDEINFDPIRLKSNDEEYHEITFLGRQKAIIDVWEGPEFFDNAGQYNIGYYNLPDDIFNEIFDLLVEFYYKTYNEDSL
jgi:hypothetical protein